MPDYPQSEYCTFIHPDGRRCRALSMPTRHVCIAHWQHDGQFEEDEQATAELAACCHTFDSLPGINQALAVLFRLTALGKLPPRKASQLAYITQLALYAVPRQRSSRDAPAQPTVPLGQGATVVESRPVSEDENIAALQGVAVVAPRRNGSGSNGSAES